MSNLEDLFCRIDQNCQNVEPQWDQRLLTHEISCVIHSNADCYSRNYKRFRFFSQEVYSHYSGQYWWLFACALLA